MEHSYETYRIIHNKTNEVQGVYSRAYHNEYDFNSIEAARCANCHDIYKDKEEYRIAKYKVTYELIKDDCDPINEEDLKLIEEKKIFKEENNRISLELFNKTYKSLNLNERAEVYSYKYKQTLDEMIKDLEKYCEEKNNKIIIDKLN